MPLFGRPVVHLDLKDFIELARDLKHGRTAVFDRLKALTDKKKVLVAISGMPLLEVLNIKDPEQKSAITGVMEQLSQTFVLKLYEQTQRMEIHNAMASRFSHDFQPYDMAREVFALGFLEAFGNVQLIPPESAKDDMETYRQVEAFCRAELMKGDILTTVVGFVAIPKPAEDGPEHRRMLDAVAATRKRWEGKSFHQQEKASILGLLPTVRRVFDEIAIDSDIRDRGLHPLFPDDFATVEFLSTLPTIYTWDKLHLYLLHKDKTKVLTVNHMYDIAQLAVAVPYCDVVVCDKEMARIVRQSKVDARFNTEVLDKLADAVEHLESMMD